MQIHQDSRTGLDPPARFIKQHCWKALSLPIFCSLCVFLSGCSLSAISVGQSSHQPLAFKKKRQGIICSSAVLPLRSAQESETWGWGCIERQSHVKTIRQSMPVYPCNNVLCNNFLSMLFSCGFLGSQQLVGYYVMYLYYSLIIKLPRYSITSAICNLQSMADYIRRCYPIMSCSSESVSFL